MPYSNKVGLLLFAAVLFGLPCLEALAKDYYVSANRGKGKKATIEKPAKDLGNIIKKLKPGDVIHIAGGTYLGRGKNGSDVITVPVSIIGGYSDDFSTRDPWGEYKTILSGVNKSKNWVRTPRLMIDLMKYREKEMPAIVVDGLIIDHAERNRYKTDSQQVLLRKANPKTKQNPTPDQGGLVVRVSKTGNFDEGAHWDVTVQNCVVINTAPSQGALSVSGYKNAKINIRNNIVANNTGTGIFVGTKYRPRTKEDLPEFLVENNTVLFTWKYDASAQSYSGNSIKFDPDTFAILRNNVFGFADRFGIQNAGKASVLLSENIIVGNVDADYLEFDTRIQLEDIEDEAEYIHEDSEENISEVIPVPVSEEWLKFYGSRILIDRNAAEADIQAQQSAANDIRSMLGLPLQAGTVKGVDSPVWLNRISLDDALKTGAEHYLEQYGSSLALLK